MFLGFTNFYKRFIKNFSRIAASLILILQTTGKNDLGAQANGYEENQDAIASTGSASGSGVDGSIKNLSIIANLAKSKKSKSTKSKKSDLPKANFAKVNSETDFLTLEAKKAFIHLQKSFTKTPIFRYFDPECHIQIETNTSRYDISGVLSQMTSDQHSFSHMTHKDPNFSKFEIGQWHLVAFFS